jgi:uncharacterized sulfatase
LQGQKFEQQPTAVSDERFRISVQTEAALSFVRRHQADPFFLYLAYFAPHVPLESPEPWFSRTPADLPLERRQALAMLAAVDEGVGQLRALLREQGLTERTLIFFIGDNGAPTSRGAWNGSLNTPLVGEKGMLTDGGIRVPFLVAWPGRIPSGQVYAEPVINLDVAATAVAVAGLPANPRLDGVNLVPYLAGSAAGPPHETLYWRWRSQAAILHAGWKLVRLGNERRFLFDLRSPEGERRNRLADEPQRAADLNLRLAAWDATLLVPGLPVEVNAQDAKFYETHRVGTAEPAEPPAAAPRRNDRSSRPTAPTQN